MAQNSDLKCCLMWKTEPPYICTPRQSYFFNLDGEDWHVKITLQKTEKRCKMGTIEGYGGQVLLLSRDDQTVTEKHFKVWCHILAGKLMIECKRDRFSSISKKLRYQYQLSLQDFKNPSVLSVRWKVYCHIDSVEPLSIQINDETALLSTGPLLTVKSGGKTIPDLQRLSEDFSHLLDKEILPDAKLTCNGRNWNVHRSILAARSEVFFAMFSTSGMVENETGSVQIEDVEPDIMDLMLKYIYSGKLQDVSDEEVYGLYEAADRYALHELRKAYSKRMVQQLSRDNCLKFLVTSEACGDDSLKEAAVDFVYQRFEMIEEKVWDDFRKEYPLLAINILERFAPLHL